MDFYALECAEFHSQRGFGGLVPWVPPVQHMQRCAPPLESTSSGALEKVIVE